MNLHHSFQKMLSREQFSGTKLDALAGLIGLSADALSTNVKAWEALTTPDAVMSKPEPKIAAFLKHISEDYHFLVNSALPTFGIELLPFRAGRFQHYDLKKLVPGQLVVVDLCGDRRVGSVVEATEVGATRRHDNGVDVKLQYPAWTIKEITLHDADVRTIQPYSLNWQNLGELFEQRSLYRDTLYLAQR